jgi:hypothetical protein
VEPPGTNGLLRLIDDISLSFDSVTSPVTGIYCLTPSDAIERLDFPAVVSEQQSLSDASQDAATYVRVRYPFVCPDGDYEVMTMRHNPASGLLVDPVDDVGSNIIVP